MSIPLQRCAAAAVLVALAPAALAQTVYVDANLASGLNDGSSWQNAFQGTDGLQAALGVVASGQDVYVADGLYRPSSTNARTDDFRMMNGVGIYGGFQGGEASLAERPAFGVAPSILTGDNAGDDGGGGSTVADNAYHVVRTNNTDSTAVLDGFYVERGAATTGGANRDRGGGILCVNGVSPTISNCVFRDNRCTFGGGAGYINNSGPSFTDCSFIDNAGGSFGGAFDIANANGVRFDRCYFEGNSASRAGALEIFSTSNTVVANSIFFDNLATGSSGGGGVWVGSGGNPELVNCTIVANRSSSSAVAGLRNQGSGNAAFANCILWGNVGQGGAQASANQINSGNNLTYSIVEGGYPGTGNSGGDPLFSDQAGGDLTLGAGSAATDAGDNTAVPAGVVLDFGQNPRFVDDAAVADTGVGPAPVVDIGAFEGGASPFTEVAGCFGNPAGLEATTPTLAVGQPLGLQLTAGAFPTGIALFYAGRDGTDPAGCGVLLPGLGEVLLSLTNPLILLGTAPTAGGTAVLNLSLPANPALAGQTYGIQGVNVSTTLPLTPLELTPMLLGTIQP